MSYTKQTNNNSVVNNTTNNFLIKIEQAQAVAKQRTPKRLITEEEKAEILRHAYEVVKQDG